MKFSVWLDTFLSEKGIDGEMVVVVAGPSGPNHMPIQVIIDAIKQTSVAEQTDIKNMLVRIDFANRSVVDYFKHLAQAIAC